MIEWQLDRHGVVLAQRGNSRDSVVGAAVSAALHKSSQYESDDYGNCRKDHAQLRKQFAMACVKGQLVFGRDLDIACEYAFGECTACIILQFLGDASKFIHKTCDSSVRGANHRTARFHTAKNGVRQMLMRTGGMRKRSGVCYVSQ